MRNSINDLKIFIKDSTSPYHAVLESKKILEKAGFAELDFRKSWDLEPGKCYYVIPYDTTLFAFTLGKEQSDAPIVRLATAHTDHPCFRVKPVADIKENNYLKINTETYGGPILNTWLDRPLSVAGQVCLKSNDIFHPRKVLFDAGKAIMTIPNLAIHLNREVNKGVELNKQKDTNPILGLWNEALNKDNYFLSYIAKQIGVEMDEILSFDLCVYNADQPDYIGIGDDFFSSPRLDNLTSVLACLKAIIESKNKKDIHMIALYDNEEIGSRSKQGADSYITNLLLEKIYEGLGLTKSALTNAMLDSMILSVDVSHGLHPNFKEKNDPTNITELGKGVVIKLDSNQKYAFDTEAIAILEQLCKANHVSYQKFVNRSDATSGSTLGSIISSWLPIKTVDIGVPLLAMHSAREIMGTSDQIELEKLLTAFFKA